MVSSDASPHGRHIQDLSGAETDRDLQVPDYAEWSTDELIEEAERKHAMIRKIRIGGWTEEDRRWFKNDKSFARAVKMQQDIVESCKRCLEAIETEAFRRLGDLTSTKPQVE